MIIEVPGFQIESVECRQIPSGKEVYEIREGTLGVALKVSAFRADVAAKAVVGAQVILCFGLRAGQFEKPELRLVDLKPCE